MWPEGFTSCTAGSTCSQRAVLPLWQMLSGQRPGFVEQGELLVNIQMTPIPVSPIGGDEEGLCSMPELGPLGPQPRLLSGPVLNWGYQAAHERLWASRGFFSQRLPATSCWAAEQQLEAARERQLAEAPWVELGKLAQQFEDRAAASWLSFGELPAAARALQETAFLLAAAVLTLLCILLPLAPVGECWCPCRVFGGELSL